MGFFNVCLYIKRLEVPFPDIVRVEIDTRDYIEGLERNSMDRVQNDTQQLLIDSFKELMIEYPFNKITIKMITDEADVIRPTFYNYFRDKYEIFEVILDEELFASIYNLIDIDMYREAIKMIFKYFGENYLFYKKAFQVTGQNSFEEILIQKIQELEEYIFEDVDLKLNKSPSILTKEQIIEYYAVNIVLVIKMWLLNDREAYEADDIFEAYLFLMTNDLQSMIEQNK